jgi:2-dehydro-3-deoxyphosphogalactonate aldolase
VEECVVTFEDAFAELPIIAILRGITPNEAEPVAGALHQAGVRIVEVAMNSPQAVASIGRISQSFAGRMVCGAGTVRTPAEVDAVAAAGGKIILSPHTAPVVIREALKRGLIPIPGFATATEAFSAIDAGATYLKLFPASTYGPGHITALGAVLPRETRIIAVGGIGPHDMSILWAAGARGFGLGSDFYTAGRRAPDVFLKARNAVDEFRRLPERTPFAATQRF